MKQILFRSEGSLLTSEYDKPEWLQTNWKAMFINNQK